EAGDHLAGDTVENLDVRPASGAAPGDDVRRAVAVDVPHGNGHAALEGSVVSVETEPRRTVRVVDLDERGAAGAATDGVDSRRGSNDPQGAPDKADGVVGRRQATWRDGVGADRACGRGRGRKRQLTAENTLSFEVHESRIGGREGWVGL